MRPWKTSLRLTPESLSLLMTDRCGNDLMKARLPTSPHHPRALLTTLEGLALWSGAPIRAVINVVASCPRSLVSSCFGDDLLETHSALVELDFAVPVPRRRQRLRGMGSFGDVRFLRADESEQ